MRETAVWESPSSRASERVDQWVASAGVRSRVVVMTRSTCSFKIVRGLPGRGSSSSPSRPSRRKRLRHLAAVWRWTPSAWAISLLPAPAAAASTIRERWASACALFGRRAQASS